MILWIVFSNPWQCLTALVSLAGAMMRCDLMLTTRKFNLSQIFWEGIIICASSVFLTHLGIARSERCGLSHKMDGKPLDYFLVLVIHDIHHLSVQTHEHLRCDLIRNVICKPFNSLSPSVSRSPMFSPWPAASSSHRRGRPGHSPGTPWRWPGAPAGMSASGLLTTTLVKTIL